MKNFNNKLFISFFISFLIVVGVALYYKNLGAIEAPKTNSLESKGALVVNSNTESSSHTDIQNWTDYSDDRISLKHPLYLHFDHKTVDTKYYSISFSGNPNKPPLMDTSICDTHPNEYMSVSFFKKSDQYSSLKQFANRGSEKMIEAEVNGIPTFASKDYSVVYFENNTEYVSFFHCDVKEFKMILTTINIK